MTRGESRRTFLERLGAGTLGAGVLSQMVTGQASARPAESSAHPDNPTPWSAPPVLTNPNILMIMVDQMRYPQGLSASQLAALSNSYLPNISGRLRNNSYVFQNFFTAATSCAAARSTYLTGLYSPQTCVYTNAGPPLSTGFPTWGSVIAQLNASYKNVWWFGKWHLSDAGGIGPNPLLPYGFQTGLYPGGLATNTITGLPYYIPSPNGGANEGLNGGVSGAGQLYQGEIIASDSMIASDFINWITGQSGYTAPATPWCTTVSLINPHDIASAPGAFTNPSQLNVGDWFPSDFPTYPPTPPLGAPPALCTTGPSNWENLMNPKGPNYVGTIKPSWQAAFCKTTNMLCAGPVPNWPVFLNQYYYLQWYVDQQVGRILTALSQSPFANNTIVIFLADHGEHGGSHGLHDKAGAPYEEAIHLPLYVQFPGHVGATNMGQMCSSVDLFGLMCDLATSGAGLWKTTCPDLANRQSLWSFLYQNAAETRLVSIGGAAAVPYILHTINETAPEEYCPPGPVPPPDNCHVIGLRTKTGGKVGFYCHWAPGNTCWDQLTPPEYEFYNYSTNYAETGNNYPSDPLSGQYIATLGNWGPPPWGANATGIIGSELDPPLSSALQPVQAVAQQTWAKYIDPCGAG